jgi:hypothetical protein
MVAILAQDGTQRKDGKRLTGKVAIREFAPLLYACGFRIDGGGVLRFHSGGTRCTRFSGFPGSILHPLRLPAQYGRHPRGSRAHWVYRAGGAAGAAYAEAVSEICRKSRSCPERIDCRSHDPEQRPVLSDIPDRSEDAIRERRCRNRMYDVR